MAIGKLGIWAATDGMSAPEAAAFAQRVERWGYGALWLPEAAGRNVLVHASWLLANTRSLTVASGIANIYARDAMASASAQITLAEQSGGRFLLGLGVSHAPFVGMRGSQYAQPLTTMRNYLEAMANAFYTAPQAQEKPLTVLAALGPKMLELAATKTDGAHPYNVTPEHTAQARTILGPGKLLAPEQMVLLENDASVARRLGRQTLAIYLGLPNYCNNLKRFGFTDDDFSDGGSDRLIDALIAWGSEESIRKRIQEHWDAGADHVCIQVIPREPGMSPLPADEKIFELLAPNS